MNRRNFIKNIVATGALLTPFSFTPLLAKEENSSIQPIDYLYKMKHFDSTFPDDYILPAHLQPVLLSLTQRLSRLEAIVGHANFMIISYDQALKIGKQYSKVRSFSKDEIDLIEMLFDNTAKTYGFMGERTVASVTNVVKEKDISKISHSGNYLFKSNALTKWKKIQKIMNNEVILTSGIRNVVKQIHLFCKKAIAHDYNISLASRSIAPAGYSFHSVGDFDVGKPGFGLRNFTQDFLYTKTYTRLVEAGVLDLRYYDNNAFGVRFEPWHVKV